MDEKIREQILERRETLLKNVEICDKMLETGDSSLLEKEYWDKVVDEYFNPESTNEIYEDGLSDEEKENLKYI